MKHLLIILISFLLLSSPVIGQETGVLYLYESSSGFVLKSFGDGKVQPKYKGEITNGEPNGFGVLTYPYGERSAVGEWKNGKEWNTKHSKKDGTLLGKYKNGEWIVSWGVFYMGMRNGENGYYTEKWDGVESEDNKDLGIYEGEVTFGFPNGQGTLTYLDGGKYVGEFKDWVFHGQGTWTSPNGVKYVGEFKDGKPNGQGTSTFPEGGKYIGEFKDGWFHGQGTFSKSNGDMYVGEFKDGNPNGQGTSTFPDGGKYIGEFKDEKYHGQGTYTYPDGGKYMGEYKDGETWNGIKYDKNGNITYKIVNGKLE